MKDAIVILCVHVFTCWILMRETVMSHVHGIYRKEIMETQI